MKATDKKPSAGELLLKVRFATHQIAAARKQAVSQYDADLRRLKQLDVILTTPEAMIQPELFQIDKVLTPEIVTLIESYPATPCLPKIQGDHDTGAPNRSRKIQTASREKRPIAPPAFREHH